MKRTVIKDLYNNFENLKEQEVYVSGWIRNIRVSKNFGFIEINDGSFFKTVQIVIDEAMPSFAEAAKYNVGSAIGVMGSVIITPDAPQPFEIRANKVTLIGAAPPDYPMQKKRHTFEFLRTMDYLRPRTNTFSAVFRIRSMAAFAIHEFFNKNGFVYVHTPIITASDCEGAGEMFRVTTHPMETEYNAKEDFFGKETSLTVSGQLEAEAMALSFGKVYTFGPTFRAENSNTPRHAAEFWMIEPEIAFADLADDMDLAEAMVKYIISYCLENAKEDIEFLNKFVDKGLLERLTSVANADFARVTYTEAVEILAKNNENFEFPVSWGCDLQTEHERYLTEKVYGKPVFVTDYPKEIKAFYMRLNDDGKTVAATDLLVPGIGELIGGSQREERYDVLVSRMTEMGMNPEDYDWYVKLRQYGGTPHAGFGLGFERMVMYVTGMQNIRDVLPFPRTVGHIGV